ncbi:decarboxylase [Candidatus Woesearchaeota archaeon]|nr:decarboxylase [Candidatus Woesearchaeota archaeon]
MARFLLSRSKALEQYRAIEDLGTISYSFKTNPRVGSLLEEETDCMFSVHFQNELKLIKDKKRVWFLAQALREPLLQNLLAQGVSKFVVENKEDLDLLLGFIEKSGYQIELLLRMKLKENTIKTEKYYVFGMDSGEVNRLLPELKSNKCISKLGVHVHRKTQNVSEWDLVRELGELLTEENLGLIDYLDIGGGLPVMYKNITDKVVPSVIRKIKELKDWLSGKGEGRKGIELIIEPGRYISGPSVTLETEIVGIHGNTIVVDASVYNSSPDTLIVPIKLLVEGEVDPGNAGIGRGTGKPKAYVIKGITPCSTDLFRYRVYFPEEKEFHIGDKILFENAGAYNFHTEFCELGKIETVSVE